MSSVQLDKVGVLLMSRLRDRGISFVERALAGEWRAESLSTLQAGLSQLSESQAALVRAVVAEALDTATHDFLFALVEASDLGGGVELCCDGVNIAQVSDGLHGELFGDAGWVVRFSKYDLSGNAL